MSDTTTTAAAGADAPKTATADAAKPPAQEPAKGGERSYTAEDVVKAQEVAAFQIREEQKKREAAERAAKEASERFKDVDLDEWAAYKADKEKRRADKAKDNPEEAQRLFEEREAKIRKELGDRILEAHKALEAKDAEIKNLRVYNKAMEDFGPHLHPSMQAIFRKQFVEAFCDLKDDELVIKDDHGNVRWSAKNPGQKMGLDEWREELKRTHAPMFLATAVGGVKEPVAEVKPSTTGGTENGLPANFGDYSPDQRRKFFADNPRALESFMSKASIRL